MYPFPKIEMYLSDGCLAFDPAGDHTLHDVFLHEEEHHHWGQDIEDRGRQCRRDDGKALRIDVSGDQFHSQRGIPIGQIEQWHEPITPYR